MYRTHTYGASRNQLTLMKMLQESYLGRLSFDDICERLEISEKTLSRYIKLLTEVYEDLVVVEKRENKRFLVLKRFSLENRTGYQLAPLYLSRFFFNFLNGTPLDDALAETVKEFESQLHVDEKKHLGTLGKKFWLVSVGPKHYKDKNEIIEKLLKALLLQRRVEITYHKPKSDEVRHYVFEPYTMLVYKQGLYLLGSSADHDNTFYLAVERISACALTHETFDYPVNYHPRAECEGSFGIFIGTKTKVTIRFDAEVANYVTARSWHPSEKITRRRDGSIDLTMEVCGTEEVFSWVLSFGEHAEIISPKKLRDHAIETTARMRGVYE